MLLQGQCRADRDPAHEARVPLPQDGESRLDVAASSPKGPRARTGPRRMRGRPCVSKGARGGWNRTGIRKTASVRSKSSGAAR